MNENSKIESCTDIFVEVGENFDSANSEKSIR